MSLLPTILSASMALLSVFTPQIQSLLSHHPAVMGGILSAWAVISHLLPSPIPPVPKE